MYNTYECTDATVYRVYLYVQASSAACREWLRFEQTDKNQFYLLSSNEA